MDSSDADIEQTSGETFQTGATDAGDDVTLASEDQNDAETIEAGANNADDVEADAEYAATVEVEDPAEAEALTEARGGSESHSSNAASAGTDDLIEKHNADFNDDQVGDLEDLILTMIQNLLLFGHSLVRSPVR